MTRPKEFGYWDVTPTKPKPKPRISKHKARLNDKLLVITLTKTESHHDFSINYDGQDLDTWEFERLIFPDLSDLSRSHLNLFSPWFVNIFAPARYAPDYEEAEKNKFPSTFKVDHWNVALHIVERVEVVFKVLQNE